MCIRDSRWPLAPRDRQDQVLGRRTMFITLFEVAILAAATGYLTFAIVAGPSTAKIRAMENLRRGGPSAHAAPAGARPAMSSGKGRNVSTLTKTLVPKGSRTSLEQMPVSYTHLRA